MKKTILALALIAATGSVFAQKKTTTSATVMFDATTDKDDKPKAENKTVIAALDTKTGAVQFEAAVKNFAFSNPMIQEHFNGAQWMNSDKFPKFSFNGQITDLKKVNFQKDGTYNVSVKGDLTVKDITKPVTAPATIVVSGGKIKASSDFSVALADYSISGAPVDAGKIAKQPKIKVNVEL